METVVCPYCDSEVKVSQIEAEEGCCPECGSTITSSVYNNYDDDFEDDIDSMDDDYEDDSNDFDDDSGDDLDEEFDDEEFDDDEDNDK